MIRLSIPDDMTTLIAIADAIGFQPSELETLSATMTDYFNSTSTPAQFWLTDDENGPVGVAYCEPERMTDQTWNLQFIAIHPDRQGQGRGTALLRHVEHTLAVRGGRLLLVETSGLPDFERTRMFYKKSGYEEEARIRDFYTTGDDKVVFRKILPSD